jgi:exopolyphosphatase/guanosine-5'-triphosphate,3'-diphosphate pyrophosphatase
LTVWAVRRAVGDALGINRGLSLIVDVGGGSTLLTLLNDGEIETSLSLRLGSIRLQETLFTSEEPPERSAELLRDHIAAVVGSAEGSLPLEGIRSFVAVGGDARFASREIGRPTESADLYLVTSAEFDRLVRRCERHAAEDLARKYGLPFAEAETLVPAMLVYQHLLGKSGASQMIVSRVSMRDGLLLELAQQVTGEEDRSLAEGVIHSALSIAEKYRVSSKHAKNVAALAVRLFDELQQDHGLAPRYRLLLQVAGLLHEVGSFVSNQAHHKHSYYLIAHSEIFGLTRHEIELVAQIARYHRRSAPNPSHQGYMTLPRESRIVVNKLAAVLRVADALVRGRGRDPGNMRFEHEHDELIVRVPDASGYLLEQRALALMADMFEEVYGLRVRLEEG